ncbi:zinc finger, CCHC-type containing protein [Tanacetum coccineum]
MILKEAGMKDCNATLCPMELGLKLSKAKDEPEVKATQYRNMVGFLGYLLHIHPDLTYSVSVQITVALSSCEAKFMAATASACYAIWLMELLAKVQGAEIVTWYARVTLFDSEIQWVIVGEFLSMVVALGMLSNSGSISWSASPTRPSSPNIE